MTKVLEEFKMELVMDVALEGVVDKEVNKQVEEFNMELVLDVAVEGVVNNEMTKVVEEVNKELVKEVDEGLLLVCRCGDVVLDKEADVEVNQEGDKDVANVVNEFSHVRTVSRSIW